MDYDATDFDPASLYELHEVRDLDKLATITASMNADGWVGTPLVAVDCGDGLPRLLNGSHRHAAAKAAGIEIPVVIACHVNDLYVDLGDGFSELVDGAGVGWDERNNTPADPYELAQWAISAGIGDKDAWSLIVAEGEVG